MVLFHGSPRKFERFKTPTGRSSYDVTNGGVVYLTENHDVAGKYAGKGGYVYKVQVVEARLYAEQRKLQGLKPKKGKYVRGVWVALPENCHVVSMAKAE